MKYHWLKSKTFISAVVALLAAAVAETLYLHRTYSYTDMCRSVALVERKSCVEITDGKGHSVYITTQGGKTGHTAAALSMSEATKSEYTTGVWVNRSPPFPYCGGRLIASFGDPTLPFEANAGNRHALRAFVKNLCDSLSRRSAYISKLAPELDYYFRTHTLIDDGFSDVSNYSYGIKKEQKEIDSTLLTLNIIAGSDIVTMVRHSSYTVCVLDSGKRKVMGCKPDGYKTVSPLQTKEGSGRGKVRVMVLQLNDPDSFSDYNAVSLPLTRPLTDSGEPVFAATPPPAANGDGQGGRQQESHSDMYGDRMKGLLRLRARQGDKANFAPSLSLSKGQIMPVYTQSGRFAGIATASFFTGDKQSKTN